MNKKVTTCTFVLLLSVAVSAQNKQKENTMTNAAPPTDKIVLITTDFGNMKVKLYNSTPQHRDNFVKLAERGFYDSLLFHRVISGFMIQGGDPTSKNAEPGKPLGNGSNGSTVPAEFVDSLYHKKGALCAARTENPTKASSDCQFYIVQGKIYTDGELDGQENQINNQRKQGIFSQIINRPENAEFKAAFIRAQQSQNQDSLKMLGAKAEEMVAKESANVKTFKYTDAQRNIYKTVGGTAQLDQGYTVYGEVIEGLDVIDKIAAVQKGTADRPVQDVRMKMKVIQ
jgi:cyclophilin family peptidyl-prolyl cis-trans isomerase